MKKTILILSLSTLFSCQKEDIKPNNENSNIEIVNSVTEEDINGVWQVTSIHETQSDILFTNNENGCGNKFGFLTINNKSLFQFLNYNETQKDNGVFILDNNNIRITTPSEDRKYVISINNGVMVLEHLQSKVVISLIKM